MKIIQFKTDDRIIIEPISRGLIVPSVKVNQLIITHLGSTNTFRKVVTNIQSVYNGDHHEKINAAVFEIRSEKMRTTSWTIEKEILFADYMVKNID